jgi:hypothetical protein
MAMKVGRRPVLLITTLFVLGMKLGHMTLTDDGGTADLWFLLFRFNGVAGCV